MVRLSEIEDNVSFEIELMDMYESKYSIRLYRCNFVVNIKCRLIDPTTKSKFPRDIHERISVIDIIIN